MSVRNFDQLLKCPGSKYNCDVNVIVYHTITQQPQNNVFKIYKTRFRNWKNWKLAATWLTFQIKITFLPFVHSQIFSAPGFSSLPPWFNNYNQKRRILQ